MSMMLFFYVLSVGTFVDVVENALGMYKTYIFLPKVHNLKLSSDQLEIKH